jgi:hypothetical protein
MKFNTIREVVDHMGKKGKLTPQFIVKDATNEDYKMFYEREISLPITKGIKALETHRGAFDVYAYGKRFKCKENGHCVIKDAEVYNKIKMDSNKIKPFEEIKKATVIVYNIYIKGAKKKVVTIDIVAVRYTKIDFDDISFMLFLKFDLKIAPCDKDIEKLRDGKMTNEDFLKKYKKGQ